MKHIVVGLFAAALLATPLLAPSAAEAQVIIQGEVTAYPSQPQPYGQPPVQQVYGSPYVQQGGAPPPARVIHHSDSIRALWVPGLIAFLGGFVFSALGDLGVAENCTGGRSGGCPDSTWYLTTWIPLVGPWIGLGAGEPRDYAWINYVGGILQTAGLLMFVLGLSIHDEWDEPIYSFNSADPLAPTLSIDGGPTGGTMTLSF